MSSIYIQEPPTHGKILLKTTFGELDIELWSREAPKACRNFVQLSLEGFYNGLIIHRLVKNFIAQTGDPTGTGTTSESIYGKPFKDEIHSRLRFTRRGLVACANSGKDDNGSQFFFTLDATPELQGKHTIFGKVAGDTLYNLIKLNEMMVDKDERPVYEQKIIKVKVLNNPFDDIVPRVLSTPKESAKVKEEKDKKKESGVKNFKLLSFGDEAEEDEMENKMEKTKYVGKKKSAHDVLNDPTLSTKTIYDDVEQVEEDESEKTKKELEAIRNKLSSKTKGVKLEEKDTCAGPSHIESREKKKRDEATEDNELGEDNYFEKQRGEEKKQKLKELRKEVKNFKKDMKKETDLKAAKEESKKKKESEKSDLLKEFEQSQEKYVKLKNEVNLKGVSREDFTFSLMKQFRSKLQEFKLDEESDEDTKSSIKNKKPKKRRKEKKKSKSSKSEDSDSEDDVNSYKWLQGQLKTEEDSTVAKDANTKSDDWYDIYDPRNPITKRRRESSKHHLTKKSKSRHDVN